MILVSVDAGSIEAAVDWEDLKSLDNCVGYQRIERFASGGAIVGKR